MHLYQLSGAKVAKKLLPEDVISPEVAGATRLLLVQMVAFGAAEPGLELKGEDAQWLCRRHSLFVSAVHQEAVEAIAFGLDVLFPLAADQVWPVS